MAGCLLFRQGACFFRSAPSDGQCVSAADMGASCDDSIRQDDDLRCTCGFGCGAAGVFLHVGTGCWRGGGQKSGFVDDSVPPCDRSGRLPYRICRRDGAESGVVEIGKGRGERLSSRNGKGGSEERFTSSGGRNCRALFRKAMGQASFACGILSECIRRSGEIAR